jgi:hypothetical protein
MPFYLLTAALFIPFNIWAAITPHLHSDLSMRILHGVSTLLLLPALVDLLVDLRSTRSPLRRLLQLVLSTFLVVLAVVNLWIVHAGMGVDMGWLDHLFLALAMASLILFYLLRPEERTMLERFQ